jgi:hypothetical protein
MTAKEVDRLQTLLLCDKAGKKRKVASRPFIQMLLELSYKRFSKVVAMGYIKSGDQSYQTIAFIYDFATNEWSQHAIYFREVWGGLVTSVHGSLPLMPLPGGEVLLCSADRSNKKMRGGIIDFNKYTYTPFGYDIERLYACRENAFLAEIEDGRILRLGGDVHDDDALRITPKPLDHAIFDPRTHTWSKLTPKDYLKMGEILYYETMLPNSCLQLHMKDGNILIIGGETRNERVIHVVSTCIKYLTVERWFHTVASLTYPRRNAKGCILSNGNAFVCGGTGGLFESVRECEEYDLTTKKWTTVARLPTDENITICESMPDGRVFVLATGMEITECYYYDSTAHTFEAAPSPPINLNHFTCFAIY